MLWSVTLQGLSLLYDFKQQHPEADIEPFLRKSSQFFQDYIEKGLKTIDMDRRRAGEHVPSAAPLTSASSMSSLGMALDHTSCCL
jgi:cytoskeleton-associated protein 5